MHGYQREVLLKVKQLVSLGNCRITIKDNGNGKLLFSGSSREAADSRYKDCFFEAFSVKSGNLILWLPHNEVA